MPDAGFAVGDLVISKVDGRTMRVVHIRSMPPLRRTFFCAWGPEEHRVIGRFMAHQIERAPPQSRLAQTIARWIDQASRTGDGAADDPAPPAR